MIPDVGLKGAQGSNRSGLEEREQHPEPRCGCWMGDLKGRVGSELRSR